MNKSYALSKEQIGNKIIKFESKKITGYQVKPRNKVREISKVNSVMIVNPSFIEKVLKRKIKKKLEFYLQYIINMLDGDDEGTDLKIALNDLTRYKSIIEYKYSKYLDQKYINLLLKKINLLEHEIKMKIVYEAVPELEEERKGKSR